MQKEERFNSIRKFLKKYEFFHQKEMMEHYPHGFSEFETWVDELLNLSHQELLELCFNLTPHKIKSESFLSFLAEAKSLMNLPFDYAVKTKLAPQLKRKLSKKKEYEIARICDFLEDKDFTTLIDVGGGIGHLAMSVANLHPINVFCFDQDQALQKTGEEKISRWMPELHENFKFIHKCFDEKTSLESIHTNGALLTGLHACGPLSSYLVKLSAHHQVSQFVNFGCCYHKLDREYNLSSLAQEAPLWFSKHALTIAAKSNVPETLEDLADKYRVKRYRYALHFLTTDLLKLPFHKIGNTKNIHYENGFSFYVKTFLPNAPQEEEIESYFKQDHTQKMIEKTIRAGLLRSILGRLIEIYIVLDRALYLKEQGAETEVFQAFAPEISPKNLLLYANFKK